MARRGIPWLSAGDPVAKPKRFAPTKIGYVHVDACELRTAECRVRPSLAIGCVSKFVFLELPSLATSMIGAALLRHARQHIVRSMPVLRQ